MASYPSAQLHERAPFEQAMRLLHSIIGRVALRKSEVFTSHVSLYA